MVNIKRGVRAVQMTDSATIASSISMVWISIAGLSFVVISAIAIAIMIVLSLIPIYTSAKDISNPIQYVFQLNVIYRTDLIDGSSLTVDNINKLSSSVNNELNLYGIRNLTAQFIPSIICMQNGGNTKVASTEIGDLLNLNLTGIYPRPCNTIRCRQRYLAKLLISISKINSNFSLSIQFINGAMSNVKLSFCSFDDYEKCQINSGICVGGTNTCSEIDIDEDCCLVDEDEDDEEEEEICSVHCDDDDDDTDVCSA